MKKKVVLIALVILICSVLGIIAKNYQNKLTQQNTQVTTNKEKEDAKNDSSKTEENSNSTLSNTPTPKDSSKATSSTSTGASKSTTPTSKNVTNQPAVENNKSVIINEQTQSKSTSPANFFIIDNVNNRTVYSSNEIFSGKTVEWVTNNVLSAKNIPYDNRGGYYAMIANLEERGAGAKSGWCFYVNGSKLSVGSSSYTLKSGDKLEWKYWVDALNN